MGHLSDADVTSAGSAATFTCEPRATDRLRLSTGRRSHPFGGRLIGVGRVSAVSAADDESFDRAGQRGLEMADEIVDQHLALALGEGGHDVGGDGVVLRVGQFADQVGVGQRELDAEDLGVLAGQHHPEGGLNATALKMRSTSSWVSASSGVKVMTPALFTTMVTPSAARARSVAACGSVSSKERHDPEVVDGGGCARGDVDLLGSGLEQLASDLLAQSALSARDEGTCSGDGGRDLLRSSIRRAPVNDVT